MLTKWTDFSRTLAHFDELQRQMNRMFDELDVGSWPEFPGWKTMTWPPANLYDTGNDLVLCAEIPGLSEKEIQITGNQEMVTITGERKVEVPSGYSVHRRERGQVKFSRSFTLPCKVDLERTSASMKNGILTVTLMKAPEAQPRLITIKNQ